MLTDQHSRRVDELQADIDQKEGLIKQLKAAKNDAVVKMDSLSAKVRWRRGALILVSWLIIFLIC